LSHPKVLPDVDSGASQVESAAQEDTSINRDLEAPSDEDLEQLKSFGKLLDQALQMQPTPSIASNVKSIGPFPILRALGEGGCGVVYLASDPVLKREVAIKVPRGSLLNSKQNLERFVQEAKIVAKLQHTNIVEIFQVGSNGSSQFLVFEYCGGGSLADWLAKQDALLPPRVCAEILLSLARAVDYAHQQGILHRDVNPRNVLLVSLSERAVAAAKSDFPFIPKLSDFGLGAWLDDRNTAVHTQTGAVLGTLPYMAPEQTRSSNQPLTVAVDIYALGVVLYELLTRKRPFVGDSQVETLRLILESPPAPPRRLRKLIPRDLETICLKCLEKSPSQRFSSAEAMAEELERHLLGIPIRTRRVNFIERFVRWAVRRRQQVGIGILVAILLATIAWGSSWYAGELRAARDRADGITRDAELQLKQESEKHALEILNAKARDEQTRREKYNDQIGALADAASYRTYRVIQQLREWIPTSDDKPDLRGFEWYYLMQRCGGDVVPMMTLTASDEEIEAMHLAESGDSVYIAHGNTISEWDPQSGTRRALLHQSPTKIRDFAVSRARQQLAFAVYGSPDIEILDLSQTPPKRWDYRKVRFGECCNRLVYNSGDNALNARLHSTSSLNSAFDGPGHLFSHGTDTSPHVWWMPFRHYKVVDIAYDSFSDQLLTTQADRIYMGSTSKLPEQVIPTSTPNRADVTSLSISREGKLLAASTASNDILVYQRHWTQRWILDVSLPVEKRRLDTPPERLIHHRNPIRFARDSRRLFSSNESGLHYWDVLQRKVLCSVIQLPDSELRHLELLPDGQTAVWTTGNVTGLWRPIEDISPIAGHDKETWSVDFSPDGKLLATGSDDETVRLWDMASGAQLGELTGHVATISDVAFAQDGRLASASLDGTVRIWEPKSGRLLRSLDGHTGPVKSLSWFADGKRLAAADSPKPELPSRIVIWDTTTGKELQVFHGFLDRINSVTITEDQRYLIATSNDKSIRIWDVESGTLIQSWSNQSPIRCATLMNQDRWVVTGDNQGLVQIRDIATASVVRNLRGHAAAVLSVAVSPDGRVVASGGEDKVVRLSDS
jgi:serine/threonine protein kinase/WD40 repeat protein